MVAADYFNPTTYTEKLKVPEGLTPSDPQVRGWFISPSGLKFPIEPWVPFIAIIPAILIFILVFMETHISEYVHPSLESLSHTPRIVRRTLFLTINTYNKIYL